MSYIEFQNVTKTIGKKQVLNHIQLQLDQGKIYGFVGANGSGKTMLMRALCGFIKLDEGKILINGKEVQFNQDLPVNIGLILETPGFVPYQSALQNLQFLLSLNQQSDQFVEPLLKFFDLWEVKDTKVKDFSLGMRQKLGIIQAVMENQDLLVLDEPTNGLDKQTIEKFIQLIQALKEMGKTIIIASHHEYEIKELADEIIEISEGALVNES